MDQRYSSGQHGHYTPQGPYTTALANGYGMHFVEQLEYEEKISITEIIIPLCRQAARKRMVPAAAPQSQSR